MQQNIYRVSKKNTHPAKAEYFHYRVTYFSENFTGYNGVILTFSPNFSSKYSPAEKLRTLENESRKIEINNDYNIMYRRLRCMKIFLSIYLAALKRDVFLWHRRYATKSYGRRRWSKCP